MMNKEKTVSEMSLDEKEKLYRDIAGRVFTDLNYLAAISGILNKKNCVKLLCLTDVFRETLEEDITEIPLRPNISPAPIEYMCIDCKKVVPKNTPHYCSKKPVNPPPEVK